MAKRTKSMIESNNELEEIRLNKYLSDAGVCSRREADKFIEEGKVKVDGDTALMGTKVRKGQVVTVNGKNIQKEEKLVLIAYNKPRGIVCTTDKREPDNIIDYINYGKRIYPIGRLDKDSEGLILLTNHGEIVNKILRAGNNHEKEYIVKVNKPITMDFLKGMGSGVPILDTVTKPCQITALDKNVFQIILKQGLNRQIRRMCEYFGYKVLELQRVRIMNINLGRLKIGDYRNVTDNEIKGLNQLIRESSNDAFLEYEDEFTSLSNTKNKIPVNEYKVSNNHKSKEGLRGYRKNNNDRMKQDNEDKSRKDRYGKEGYGNDKYGNDKHGNDRYGNDKHGNDKYGKHKYGKDNYSNDKYGKEEFGKERFDNIKFNKEDYSTDKYDRDKFGGKREKQNKGGQNIDNKNKRNQGFTSSNRDEKYNKSIDSNKESNSAKDKKDYNNEHNNDKEYKYTKRSQKLMSKNKNALKKDGYKAIVKGKQANKFSRSAK